jgi:hypothetical protein
MIPIRTRDCQREAKMPTFTLNTAFDQNSLNIFYQTGTNVVVAKPSSSGGTPNVAWVVFRPLPANSMTWQEQYGIYASTSSIQNGATLIQMSATSFPAGSGQMYTLSPAGVFTGPTSGGAANTYTASNQYNNLPSPGYLTFGLYQNATVNNTSLIGNAVSAAPVMYQSTAVMTPYTTIYIWTQSQVQSNTVVTVVTSVTTQVTFGGTVSEVSLQYDPTTGGFVTTGTNLQLDESSGKLIAEGGKPLKAGLSLAWQLPVLG